MKGKGTVGRETASDPFRNSRPPVSDLKAVESWRRQTLI